MGGVTGILLAAGASRRFGADKLSQRLPDGEWVAVQACRNLMAAVDRVVAVVRPDALELSARLAATGAQLVEFADANLGMGHSLAFGVASCRDAAAWLVALADMPWIKPETIAQVANALKDGALIAAPSRHGRRGHPVGFSAVLVGELLALAGDNGGRPIIDAHADQLVLLETGDAGILKDIDLPRHLYSPTDDFPC